EARQRDEQEAEQCAQEGEATPNGGDHAGYLWLARQHSEHRVGRMAIAGRRPAGSRPVASSGVTPVVWPVSDSRYSEPMYSWRQAASSSDKVDPGGIEPPHAPS